MTNLKLTKRALLSSVLALFLCFAMLVGTTFAWFTDSVTSADNKIVSGTLDVQLFHHTAGGTTEITDSNEPVFPADILWEPGYTHVVYLSIKNNGTLALKYKVALEITQVSMKELTDVMSYAITPDAKVGDVTSWAGNGIYVDERYHDTAAQNVALQPGDEHFFALSVHMDEEAGNEYMNQSIAFDIKVIAGQLASESDSFGTNYDANAKYAGNSASAPIVAGEDVSLSVRDDLGTKLATFYFPAETIDQTASELKVNVEITNKAADRYDFEITVDGIVDGNTTPIRVQLRIPTGLDSSAVKVYHNDTEVTDFVYVPTTGYVHFDTTSFSPFAVEFDPDAKVVYTAAPENVPVAEVTDITAECGTVVVGGNDIGPDLLNSPSLDAAQTLEAMFEFVAPHNEDNIDTCEYKDWFCDYYVSIDRSIKAGSIVLGGQYDAFSSDWIAFSNPIDIEANEVIPLLGSVVVNEWTYAMIAAGVGTFNCGVAEAIDAPTNLAGATFTVRLRVTNPENANEYFDVNTVTYTFGVDGGVTINNINE